MSNIQSLLLKISSDSDLKKIINNAIWLSSDRIVRMLVNFFLVGWTARYLGTELFGVMNYSYSYIAIFATLTILGMEDVAVKEFVHRDDSNEILGTMVGIKLAASCLFIVLAIYIIRVIHPTDSNLHHLVGINSISLIFLSFSPLNIFFQARSEAKYLVVAQNSSFMICSVLKLLLLYFNGTVIQFVYLNLFESLISSAFLLGIYSRNGHRLLDWSYSRESAKRILLKSWPFAISGLFVILYMKIDVLMLGSMISNTSAGIYSAAVKISELWYFIPIAIVNSMLPSILRAKIDNKELYRSKFQNLLNVMSLISITFAIFITFTSTLIIKLIYGEAYSEAVPILTLHIWSGIPVCLGVATNGWLIAEDLQQHSFYRTIAGCLINILLNYLLLPSMGGKGAAIATLISYSATMIYMLMVPATRESGVMAFQSLLWPFKISIKFILGIIKNEN